MYVVDNKHLFIRNFRYEKTGPGKEGYDELKHEYLLKLHFFTAGAHFWVGDGPQPSPKGRIVPYPQNPDDIDLFEIMNSIEEERRRKNMQRFNQINNLDNSGLGGNSGESGDTKDGSQPKYGRREPPYLQRMKG